MYNLEELNAGKTCTICWLLGEIGKQLKERMHFELDDKIDIVYNDGNSLIIKHSNKKYAIDSISAHAIKVSF